MPALIATLVQCLQLGVPIVVSWVEAYNKGAALAKSGTAPTPEVQAEIDAALDAAHAALQAAEPGPG